MYPPPPLSVISSLLGFLAWTTSFLPFHQACGSGLALLLTQSNFIMVSITLLFTYFNWEQSILWAPHLPLASLHNLSKQWPYWLKTPFSDKYYQTPMDLLCSFTVSPSWDLQIAAQVLSIFRREWAWSAVVHSKVRMWVKVMSQWHFPKYESFLEWCEQIQVQRPVLVCTLNQWEMEHCTASIICWYNMKLCPHNSPILTLAHYKINSHTLTVFTCIYKLCVSTVSLPHTVQVLFKSLERLMRFSYSPKLMLLFAVPIL